MQTNRSDSEASDIENGQTQKPPYPDFRWSDLPGILTAGVLVFIVLASIFACHFVNEHSAKITFVVGATFSFLGLLVITAQALIYAQQAVFMREQLTTQRAFLMVESGVTEVLKEGERAKTYIVFKNSGSTPANNIVIRACSEVRDTIPKIEEIPDFARGQLGGAVAPQQTLIRLIETAVLLSPEQITAINAGESKTTVVTWGIATYWDTFGNKRRTKFCVGKRKKSLAVGPVGNENEAD